MSRPIPLFYDYETFWDVGYSLSNMNVFQYMSDERFEFVSLSARIGSELQQAWGHDDVMRLIRSLPWERAYAIAHNGNAFDHLVTYYKGGRQALRYGDTLCMARPHFNQVSLGYLVEALGIGRKNNAVLLATKGKRAPDFSVDERKAMLVYNDEDTTQLMALFTILLGMTSGKELKVIDMTAKKACCPSLVFDMQLLRDTLCRVQQGKEDVLRSLYDVLGTDNLDDTRGALMSNAKFAKVLEGFGVAPPMKVSATTGKATFAFAKTDEGFEALKEHPDPRVQAVASARLGAKSTLLETRLQTMIDLGNMTSMHWCPITLAYYGAQQTGRLSGYVWNPQNLSRVNPKAPALTDALRMAIMAPDGKMVVVRDLSGIELRTNMTLSGQWDQVELLRIGEDLYLYFAAHHLYHRVLTKADKLERQVGKLSHLSLGYGAGGDTFGEMARQQNVMLDLTPGAVVRTYRQAMHAVAANWKRLANAIPLMLTGERQCVDSCGLIYTDHEALVLPSGRKIRYPGLHKADGEWLFRGRKGRAEFDKRVYGGLMAENCSQAIARDIITYQALEVHEDTPVAHLVHDEIICVTDEDDAPDLLDWMGEVMGRPLDWWPQLPLASEGSYARRYGEAK